MLHHRQARDGEETLHHIFIHAGSGAEHSCADVRNSGEFEKALNSPVFSEGSMKHGEDHIDINCLVCLANFRRGSAFEWNQRVMLSPRLRRYDDGIAARKHSRSHRVFRIASAKMPWIALRSVAAQQLLRFAGG